MIAMIGSRVAEVRAASEVRYYLSYIIVSHPEVGTAYPTK